MLPENKNYPTKLDNINFYGFILLLIIFSLTFLVSHYLYVALLTIGLVLIARGRKFKRKILTQRYDYSSILISSIAVFTYIVATEILFKVTYISPPCYEGIGAFRYKLEGLAFLFYLFTSLVALVGLVFNKNNKVARVSKRVLFLSIVTYSLAVIFLAVLVFIFGDTAGCPKVLVPIMPTSQ